MRQKSFNISGMHCRACKTLIESELAGLPGVEKISVDHVSKKAEIEFDETKTDFSTIEKNLRKLNYSVQKNKKETKQNKTKTAYWLSALLALLLVYFTISQSSAFELLSRLNEGNVGLALIFLIGVLSSFHCIGMCGGIIVSFSAARIQKKDHSLRAHWQYNLGRLISYTTVGAILGTAGSFFGLNPNFTGFIVLLASVFMILFGLSLSTEFKIFKRLKLHTPDFVARFIWKNKKSEKPRGPFVIGLLTAFMPCGPLQAMQVYALSTGSFLEGGLAMMIYALGTAPLLLGFGKVITAISENHVKKMIKISGLIVIFLGLMLFNKGLANFGLGAKAMFSPIDSPSATNKDNENVQTVRMAVTYRGYVPNVIYLKKDVPVRWIIEGDQVSGCTDEIQVPEFGIKQALVAGEEAIVEFTPTRLGEIKFHCWMKMVWGKFIVTENGVSAKTASPVSEQLNSSSRLDYEQGSCGGSCGNGCSDGCSATQASCSGGNSSRGCGCSR